MNVGNGGIAKAVRADSLVRMKTRVGLGVWLMGWVLMTQAGCGGGAPEGREAAELPLVKVQAERVQVRPLVRVQELGGTVEADVMAEVSAKVMGQVSEVGVVAGQRVASGEVLVRLSAPEMEARVMRAESAAREAEIELSRISRLLESKAASPQDFDRAEAAHGNAQAALREARTYADYLVVEAPFAGVVSVVEVDLGDLASPGTLLIRMYDDTKLMARVEVPESLARTMAEGDLYEVRVGGRSEPLQGSLYEKSPVSDPVRRTVTVKLLLPGGSGVQPGEFARVDLPVPSGPVLQVPELAVIHRGQLEYVYLVEEGRARLRLVKTGRSGDGWVELLSGVREGETLVLSPLGGLTDGQRVE